MALTPKQLRRMAEEEREDARLATVRAELYDRTADELDRALTTRQPASSVRRMINTPASIVDVAKSRAANHHGSALVEAANAKGYSLRRLARELGVSHGLFTYYLKEKRPIPMTRALEVEKLIGFAATSKNWPCGISG